MDDILAGRVPVRLPESAHMSNSEDDVCPSPTPYNQVIPSSRSFALPVTITESGDMIDDHDCWSQDDDDIITVSIYCRCLH